MTDDWLTSHEWEPKLGERVYHYGNPDLQGAVTRVDVGGPHVGDRDWWVWVSWDDGTVGQHIASCRLYRLDGTQGSW